MKILKEDELKILPLKTRNLLKELSQKDFIKDFYLAGGTALVLEFKHRISNDLDFFSDKEFNTIYLKNRLKKIGEWDPDIETENTLIGRLNSVKCSFFYLPYGLIGETIYLNKLRIADLNDIALMKILAISQRATKRDFIDLYILTGGFKPLPELLKLFPKKFGKFDYNFHHIIKSLIYFDEADKDKMPRTFTNIDWKTIKKFFIKEQENLLKILIKF